MGITPRILFAAHCLYMAVHIFMKTNRKRVVITGIGILSSLAENLQDFRNALLNKKNGVTDSVRFSKWFENARAAEVLHDIDYSELPDDVIASLDNAALWAYKVGKDALNQAGLAENKAHLKETGLIVGVSSAGTEAFLPLFEQRMEDFSLRKALFSGGFSSCCSSVSTLLGLQGGVELVALGDHRAGEVLAECAGELAVVDAAVEVVDVEERQLHRGGGIGRGDGRRTDQSDGGQGEGGDAPGQGLHCWTHGISFVGTCRLPSPMRGHPHRSATPPCWHARNVATR